jgi:hypothetical protein
VTPALGPPSGQFAEKLPAEVERFFSEFRRVAFIDEPCTSVGQDYLRPTAKGYLAIGGSEDYGVYVAPPSDVEFETYDNLNFQPIAMTVFHYILIVAERLGISKAL